MNPCLYAIKEHTILINTIHTKAEIIRNQLHNICTSMPPVALGILQIELIHQIILLKFHDALFQQKCLRFKNRHPKTFPLATAIIV